MSGDKNRVDLDADLDQVRKSMVADLHAASAEVKQQQDADRAKEAQKGSRGRSRKTSAIVVAVAAVVLLLVSYFIVFGGQGGEIDNSAGTGSINRVHSSGSSSTSAPTRVTPYAPQAPPRSTSPVGGRAQNVYQPPDGYVQPGDDAPGM